MQDSILRPQPEQAWISDLDPMLEGGFKVVFKEALSLEVQSFDENGAPYGIKDMFVIRILSRNSNNTNSNTNTGKYQELKIQISSEADIFVVYVCNIDERKFERMRKQQNLNFNFSVLLSMLTKQIVLCDKSIKQFCAILSLKKTTSHKLDFLENIQYKRIELISLEFQELDSEQLKNCITYRFTKAKTKNQMIQNRLKEMIGLVKLKNHALINTIAKNIVLNDPNLTK